MLSIPLLLSLFLGSSDSFLVLQPSTRLNAELHKPFPSSVPSALCRGVRCGEVIVSRASSSSRCGGGKKERRSCETALWAKKKGKQDKKEKEKKKTFQLTGLAVIGEQGVDQVAQALGKHFKAKVVTLADVMGEEMAGRTEESTIAKVGQWVKSAQVPWIIAGYPSSVEESKALVGLDRVVILYEGGYVDGVEGDEMQEAENMDNLVLGDEDQKMILLFDHLQDKLVECFYEGGADRTARTIINMLEYSETVQENGHDADGEEEGEEMESGGDD